MNPIHIMGAVFRPKDYGSRDNRKVIENAVSELSAIIDC
jgi:hypothetical protein